MNTQGVQESENGLLPVNFPMKAKEVLRELDIIYETFQPEGIPWSRKLWINPINLYLYNLVDGQDLKKTKLSKVQQLSLADIILEYLSLPKEYDYKVAVFNAIFYSDDFQKGDVPLYILGLVASLALAFQKTEILQVLASWMSNAGLESPSVVYVALQLSNDMVNDEFPEKYNYLPLNAAPFTAIFLIAVGKAYKNTPPPRQLIIQVTTWIEGKPHMCLIPPLVPVMDLFRWCLQSFQENELEKSSLHLALLTVVQKTGKRTQLKPLPEICDVIQELKVKKESAEADSYNGEVLTPKALEKMVDLLLQIIQMFISVDCLDINETRTIFDSLDGSFLPRTELYQLMKAHHLESLFYTFREPKSST